MSSKPRKTGIIFSLCALVFVLGLGGLFWLRFQAGDLYPPYSSLRGDPLGIQVFFESVQSVGEAGAERSFRALDQVAMTPATTLLVCGVHHGAPLLEDRAWERLLERLSSQGGRLVLAFRPTRNAHKDKPRNAEENSDDSWQDAPEDEEEAGPDDAQDTSVEATPEPENTDDNRTAGEEDKSQLVPFEAFDLLERLGLSVEKLSAEEYDDFAFLSGDWPDALPETIPWRAHTAFDLQAPEWEVVYWWQEAPAVVQRPWGQGTIVLAADSYLFSNEALRGDRVTELLAWWAGLPNRLLVDEFHHGLVKQPGIADLVRKYRLQGAAAGLLILVALLLWRQAAPFAPTPADIQAAAEESAVGRGAEEGWVGLMRQHIPTDDLLGVCHEAWRNSPAVNRVPDERVDRLKALMRAVGAEKRRGNPVTLYRQICQLLKEGKHS
ncbi:MAG: hypothetical protein HY911_15275 [Desulfobacterales bacterium]|nr:hypothetical protein [Desulfobacterales bacterium]